MSYSDDLNALVSEVQALIDGDDIRIVAAGIGSSGSEDLVWLACGKTESHVFRLHDRKGTSIEKQMMGRCENLRAREAQRIVDEAAREAKRIADEEAVQSTVARFYADQIAEHRR